MEILTYRDLGSKDGLLPLLDHAFRWTFNPRKFEDSINNDPRLRNGPVGFCAMEDDRVIGFVGVLDLTTRTLDGGLIYVGGVYGVATLPSHVRKGVSTALMNSAHQYFRDNGYRFSFLTTSHTIIAHSFYEKLGYTDLLESPSAYKVLKTKKEEPNAGEKPGKLDLDRILKLYKKLVKGKTGFVVRDKAYLRMLKKSEGLTAKQCIIDEEGYVLFRRERSGIWIRELVASNVEKMNRLVDLVEREAKDLVYDRAVLDDRLLKVYKSRDYMIQKRSHSVVMVKPLTADASLNRMYGDRLHMTGLDFF